MEAFVDDLFRWYTDITIGGTRQIWVRILSALDESERNRAAVQISRKARARLLTEGSPERDDLLVALKGLERKDLLAIIRLYQTEQAQALAQREVQPKKDPPVPVEPTLVATLDAEDEWMQEIQDVAKRRIEFVQDHIRTYMVLQEAKSDEELLELATDLEINVATSQFYMEEYNRQTIWRSCFKDKKFKERAFSLEKVFEMSGRVFGMLLAKYNELDRFATDSEALKN